MDEELLGLTRLHRQSDIEALCEHAAHVVPWFLMLSVLAVGVMSGCALFVATRRVDALRVD